MPLVRHNWVPLDKQEKVAEHPRYNIANLEDEIKQNKLFKEIEAELSGSCERGKTKSIKR